jgi:acyl-phosphate glycerol 3-phosphate acyltransferase
MLIAYLAGSIPVGVIVARLVGGPDLRSIGSGRTGGTNAIRALGRKWAAVVVLGDLLKGALPVLLARYVTGDPLVEVLCGISAVAGAIWSVFVGFRSGRGVGTGVGTMLVMMVVPDTPLPYVIYSAVGTALIWLAHADNIERLLKGEERKFDLALLGGKHPTES